MSKIKWYYRDSLKEASSLLRNKKIIPHGGGTHLNNTDLSHVEGLLDLSGLKLNYINKEKDIIKIGSMSTYAEVVNWFEENSPECLLLQTLHNSANTPLQNRITIGGSLGHIPQWSDLIGALLALEAKVILMGKNKGEYNISDFWNNNKLRESSLIVAVKFKDVPHKSFHYREIKTNNDMPLFTITTLFDMQNGIINNMHAYIGGTRDRVSKLAKLERYMIGKKRKHLNGNEIKSLVNVIFIGNRTTDNAYLAEKAKIETWRSIIHAMEKNQ